MADDLAHHRRNQSANSAIALQNLADNGTHERAGALARDDSHRRTLSDRGRALFSRNSRSGTANAPYAPIRDRGDGSPTPGSHTPLSPIAYVTTPSGQHERIPDEDDEVPMSPITDISAFQDAIGFAALSFNAEHHSVEEDSHDEDDVRVSSPPGHIRRGSRATLASLPPLQTEPRNSMDMVSIQLDDGPAFYSPSGVGDEDMIPLTNMSRLRASDIASPSSPAEQRPGRARKALSNLSVRFSPGQHDRRSRDSSTRLGDELNDAELGSRNSRFDLNETLPSRKRSLSPGVESPLRRTGTILRNMSQRVVNLSNESEPGDRERTTPRKPPPIPPRIEEPRNEPHAEASMDGTAPPRSPASGKFPPTVVAQVGPDLPIREGNPLKGKSLGIFSPENKIRKALLTFLVHPLVEPFILFLIVVQTVVLAIDSAPDVYTDPRPKNWGTEWSDMVLLAIFSVYTAEIMIKVIVSGLIFNPTEYSTIDRSVGIRQAMKLKADELFALHRKSSKRGIRGENMDPHATAPDSLLHSFTTQNFEDVPGKSRYAAKKRLAYRAFLRHSFNRLDFVAVVSFWISFVLGWSGAEYDQKLYVFRMMSCLRILRLLGITSGTSVILRSLKRAAPTLLNIAFLIGFFWLLFSIVGVQSFKSSLRRTCTYIGDPGNLPPNQSTQNQPPPAGNFQFCGGWLKANESGVFEMPWLTKDGQDGIDNHKGYLCPVGSICVEGSNPYNNTISFDNIFQSAELVFVIMTSNTFTDIMYYLMDSDYVAAALFFACGIIFLTFWLISLLIAVITSAFQVIREESRSSAFMAEDDPAENESGSQGTDGSPLRKNRISSVKRAYKKSYWVWIIVIVFDLVVQSLRTDTIGPATRGLISTTELIVTLVLMLEIVFRFVSDWRDFRHHPRNWFDLFLAVMTCIIQLPFIKNSGDPYAWLTVFQILRIYRVVLAVQMTRDLIMLVLRHVSGVVNLILFVFLLTFLAAIFAAQLFRGQLPILDDEGNYIQVTFATIFNSFLGMYQVLSSENWTAVMYNVARFEYGFGTAWIAATFFIIWFTLANFVVLNMFIAVIQENFDVSEDQKRMQQVRMFLQKKENSSGAGGTLSLSTVFKFGMMRRQDPLDFGNAAEEMLLKDAVVRDFLDEDIEDGELKRAPTSNGGLSSASTLNLIKQPANFAQKLQKLLFKHEPNPFYGKLQLTKPYEELDPRTLAKEVMAAADSRKALQREYLRKHPRYNVSLFIFGPNNPIRKMCQRIVGPGRGTRIEGVQPNVTIWYSFSAFIYLAIVGMVLLACVTTPLYQYEYFRRYSTTSDRYNWFVYSDIGFAGLFTVEAIIKVIADGFFWSPNAYFRSSWGFIDGIVLITLWINVITSLYDPGSGSRAVGAFKALRALRLLNISDSARDTFHSVIVLGGWKVLSAAFVSLSLLIPFAIYGLNLFAGKMSWCNDWQQYQVHNLTDCVGEGIFSPIGYDMLAPRRVAPVDYAFDFDSFGDALFILFQVVSQEGWVDLMWSGQSITGVFTQPAWFSQQGNAAYFVVFNLLGAVFVLTLFVSVFMRNYTEQTGVAFLTSEQRSWMELRKLLRQVAPSKRPNRQRKRLNWQEWAYRRAVTKNGRWQRTITGILIAHLILLCLEWYPEPGWWATTRFVIFFLFLLFYVANIVIRIMGLSWFRFRKSAWDVYSLLFVSAALVTSVMVFSRRDYSTFAQIHKLFLVAVSLLLIPRNNQLDQLFKTAAASFSAIANLLATWFVLFLVYAIAFTQTFGLTRFGPNETGNINFRTVPKALILLFRLSVGEQWNQIMMDYANIEPPYCTVADRYYEGDCGSKQWSYALFVSWNIISMYIFVNLFISLIYESFSYVYQRSSGLSIISREEIRRFKQAWAEYDPNGTGYISKEVFPRFLGELSGIFEMRIYDGDFTVSALVEDCRVGRRRTSSLPVDGAESSSVQIDLAKLNKRLAELPVEEIRRRRARMNTFYEEVLVSANPDRGIAFSSLLMVLAHYKVINDSKSLKLEEFLRRRARLQRVEEAVNRNVVVGFFDTLYWSRKFKRRMEARKDARVTMIPQFDVPEILIQDEDGEGVTAASAVDIPAVSVTPVDYDASDTAESFGIARAPTSSSEAGSNRWSGSSAGVRNRSSSIQLTPAASPTREEFGLSPRHRPSPSSSSIQPDWHFAAAFEGANRISPPGSPGLQGFGDTEVTSARSRANSAVSQHEVVGMFQDSAWGQSMRRSVTQRRSNSHRRPSS